MDVFGLAVAAGGDFLCAAAVDAAHELGLYARLADGPATLAELAAAADVVRGQRRLGALCDVLAATGALDRLAPGEARFAAPTSPPPRPVVPRAGWGLLADVIRRDRPLPPEGGALERRYQLHLARAGAAAARELAPLLAGPSLLDLGGGAGAYTAAFLAAHPGATATLVDVHDVLALAAVELAAVRDRVRLVGGDARVAPVGAGHGAVLLSNLLHLHGPSGCAGLCAAAARAVAPGGVVVVKDLRVDEDRGGPLAGLLFALNMAIYTDEGDVHAPSRIRTWLEDAGLVVVEERRLAAAPDAIVLLARRPTAAGSFPRSAGSPGPDLA